MGKFFTVLTLILLRAPIYFIFLKSPPLMPDIDLNEWWGPEQLKTKQDTNVKPFKVKLTEVIVKDLKERLKAQRPFIPALEDVAFEYGFNSKQMNNWFKYWAEEYPSSERKKLFSKYPCLELRVPAGVEIVPLLLLHGWPGSVRELDAAIPLLTAGSKDRDFALEVIVPNLPDFGFSDMGKFFIVLTLILLGAPIYFIFLKSPPPMPNVDLNEWWGPEKLKTKQDTSVKPFKVKFTEVMVKDLKERLKAHRPFVPALEDVAFEYGFNSKQMNNWIKYWAEEYPFSERENIFNKYPQFKTNIQGLDIHFIRVKPEVPAGVETVPLLLLHGWPGSVREFDAAIPLLTAVSKDRDFALEVIIPSLPGYGFSDAAVRPGLGADKVAVVFKNLMNRLGFKKYFIQGGDWGGIITSNMATMFPEDILGYHSNIAFSLSPKVSLLNALGAIYPPLVVKSEIADRMYPLGKVFGTFLEEMGYLHIQATKPDTVGVALADSPSGLLAYILEKFSSWTTLQNRNKPDGGLGTHFTKEQLIDNLMMYWATNSITTSMRLYSETFNKRYIGLSLDDIPTPVPTWFIQAKNELSYLPAWMLRFKFKNLIEETIIDDGGHFLAMELPKVFTEDVLKAITAFRKWHKQNTAKTEL